MSFARWTVRLTVVVGVVFATAAPARADAPFHIPVYTGTPLMISAGVVAQQSLNRSFGTGSRRSAARTAPDRSTATAVEVDARSRVPARMAAALPAPSRAQAERAYRQMLDLHPTLMRRLGAPPHDAAAALATFIAGIYVAYHDEDFPDRRFLPLYRQMRDVVAAAPDYAAASARERSDLHAELAILGTFLALTRDALTQRPDARVSGQLKAAAADYLRRFMDADAARMRITEQGLRLD